MIMTKRVKWAAVLLISLAYFLMVSSAIRKSATVDEQSHLFRGIAYLKTGATHFLLGHPIFGSALSALPLLSEPDLRLPVDDPAWEAGNWSLAGDRFLWQLNDNPQKLLFLGRLPVMWLTLLLGALVFRWAGELKGAMAAIFAGILVWMDPNILANGRLITGDLALTFFYFLTIYSFWRWYRNEQNQKSVFIPILVTALGLGLAGVTKFNAVLLVPTMGLLALGLAVWRRSIWPLVVAVVVGLSAWVVIWVVYRFSLSPLPGGAFWDDLFWELQYFERAHGAYLAGQSSPDGWWYYFPATFLIKTPISILLGLILAIILVLRKLIGRVVQKDIPLLAFLALPPALYMAASLTGSLNIGYRYLLPMLPFLAVGIALTLTRIKTPWRWILPVWLVGISLVSWPDYIPFFNWLAGGPNNGWKILSDSNVDWGQDLPALADWQAATGRPLKLSYFGTAHPSAYGLIFEALPTWAPGPEQALPGRQAFYPPDPAPGWYAISVTNLHGVVLGGGNQDIFAWFQEREPQERIGNSIFLYEVPARGETADVAFSGLEPRDLSAEMFGRFGTNDIQARWFDAGSSLIVPEDGGQLVVNREQLIEPDLLRLFNGLTIFESEKAVLYEVGGLNLTEFKSKPQDFEEVVRFLGNELLWNEEEIRLVTAWEVLAETERPLKIFVHALDENGGITSQWDGLDVDPGWWRVGDQFVQVHQLAAPEGEWRLVVGVYDGETLERLGEMIELDR